MFDCKADDKTVEKSQILIVSEEDNSVNFSKNDGTMVSYTDLSIRKAVWDKKLTILRTRTWDLIISDELICQEVLQGMTSVMRTEECSRKTAFVKSVGVLLTDPTITWHQAMTLMFIRNLWASLNFSGKGPL